MDFPILDLPDEQASYACLVAAHRPRGLRRPGCRGSRYATRRSRRGPVLDYRCAPCGRVFNAWTAPCFRLPSRRQHACVPRRLSHVGTRGSEG